MAPFGEFLSTFIPKYCLSLLKFLAEVFSHNTKTVFEQSSKNLCLSSNGTYPKFIVLVYLWDWFTPGKRKILLKNKTFPKTISLGLSNNTSPRSQKNHRILIRLIKKNVFWDQNGLFKVKNKSVVKDQEVKDQISTTFL